MFGRRTDEFDADGFADLGKVGIFGKESIAGMDGVRSGDLGCTQNVGDISIAEGGVRRSDADLLVSGANMEACRIGFGKDCHGFNAEFLAGTNHPERDLTAIGYQHFLKHASTPMQVEGRGLGRGSRVDEEECLTILHRLGAFSQNLRHPSIYL